MMRQRSLFASIVAAFLAPAFARANPACLPPEAISENGQSNRLELAMVENVPTLCGFNSGENKGLAGCWAVDPKTGALSASTTTFLPGHSQQITADAQGCIYGYCMGPATYPDRSHLFAPSTDGSRVAILRYDDKSTLYVFDAKTKAQQTAIALQDDKAPKNTIVGNEPIKVLYVGDALYVVGSDAGPYIAVWGYKDDGTRTGVIGPLLPHADSPNEGFSVYNGGVNIIDESHIALVLAGLRTMLIVSTTDGARDVRTRSIGKAPCTEEEMQNVDAGTYDVGPNFSAACHKWVVRNLEPYFDLNPIALPSGDFLAVLSRNGFGWLVTLDGKTLLEKRRTKLARCAK